MKIKQRS